MKKMKTYLSLLAGLGLSAGLALGASTATATTIVIEEPLEFTISWSQTVIPEGAEEGDPTATLSGNLVFTVDSFTDDKVVFNIVANHTTDLAGTGYEDENVFFTAFGFDTDPSLDGASITEEGDYFDGVSLTQNLPGYRVELCSFTGQNCRAADDGVPAGVTDSFQLTLTGDFSNGLVLSNFIARHAGDLGSFTFPTNGNGVVPPDAVPEPASLALLGLGLVALAAVTRRRRGLKPHS